MKTRSGSPRAGASEWRRGRLLAGALIAVLVLTACEFRIHADLVIEEDESGTLSVEMSMDKELAALVGNFGGELVVGDDVVPSGWATETLSGEEYEGFRASTGFGSLEELGQRLGELAEQTDSADTPLPTFLTDMSPTREGDRFLFELVIPEGVEGLLGEGLEESPIPIDLGMLDDVFDIRLSLVLPGELISENADFVTGQTLVWNLSLNDGARVLEATSELPVPNRTRFVVWGVTALALLAAVVAFLRMRARGRIAGPPVEGSSAGGY